MGCDIHLYREKKVGEKWVTADTWKDEYGDGPDVPWELRFHDRNYELFGLLSKGVRSEHNFSWEPRGIPFNACVEIKEKHESWGVDGHSASYLYLHELKEMRAYLDQQIILVSGMKDQEELEKLKATIAAGKPDWSLLFPYSQWTNQSGWVNFEIEVPASFYVGDSLDEIIKSFDGIDGENHRIVFFFDN